MSVKIQITAIFLRFDNSNCQNNSDICQNIILDTITLSDLQYRIILFPFYKIQTQSRFQNYYSEYIKIFLTAVKIQNKIVAFSDFVIVSEDF